MKTEKRQFGNRMGAAVLLLALVCAIGYAVNSFTQLGQKGFHGTLNYKTNHFGMQEVSLNLNGEIAKDWFYSGSIYQDFDPGTFKIKSTPFQDRTQIYKFALTNVIMIIAVNLQQCIIIATVIRFICMLPSQPHLYMLVMVV